MRITSIVVIVGLLYFPLSGFAGETLKDAQIKETFSGKTTKWQHLFKTRYGKTYYAADGTLTGTINGSKREGTWHIAKNELCFSWARCFQIKSDGKSTYYLVVNGVKKVVRVTILGDGNLL